MCTTPAYLAKDALGQGSRATLVDALEQPDLLGQLAVDGEVFRTKYLPSGRSVYLQSRAAPCA